MTLKKGKKMHLSKVKRKNIKQTKLAGQGKTKSKKHKSLLRSKVGNVQPRPKLQDEMDEDESDCGEGLLEMVEKDDITFLKNAISNRSYSFLKNIHYKRDGAKDAGYNRSDDVGEKDIEDIYERNASKSEVQQTKYLLPIKTKDGFVLRTTEDHEIEDNITKKPVTKNSTENEEDDIGECFLMEEVSSGLDLNKPISTAELLACREGVIQTWKFRIGVLSSGLLENPDQKMKNFKLLLDMLEEKDVEVCISVRKLAAVSLLEVFKDLLPSYQIKHHEKPDVKLKKDTRQLQTFEKALLKFYKTYLQKLEKLTSVLQRRKGQTTVFTQQEVKLAEMAVNCLCELLALNPYFNFSCNIAQMLVPFLDHSLLSVRQAVATCLMTVLREDKRGEVSLNIVRYINHLVKSRSHSVQCEVLKVLLALRIKEVNLDREKDDEIKQKKFMTHKQKLLRMSKRERKRSKKLEELEKELLETKAEENKQTKHQFLTEITKVVFTIYFRVLKCAPSSKLLGVTLEGLARFAHCINVDFYCDLMNVMDTMIERESLGCKEQLHCVQTVFTVLSGQGDLLNIDPSRFYTHLYRNLLSIHAGCNHSNLLIALKALEVVLIRHRKRLSQQRLLAFTKRLCILSLQLLHNGSIGCLSLVKAAMQMNKSVDVLLDTDASFGESFYLPELEEPEYCNASNSSLWELTELQRHYHPTVKKFAQNILRNVPTTGVGSLPPELAKLSCEQLYLEFDSSEMAFHPSIPVLKNLERKIKHHEKIHLRSEEFEMYINQVVS